MTTRRKFLLQTAGGLALAPFVSLATAVEEQRNHGATVGTSRRKAGNSGPRIQKMIRRHETILRLGGNGDNWHMSWGSDDRQYLSLCDGAGFSEQTSELFTSRLLAISGGPQDATFHDLPGYPKLARPMRGRRDTRYYNFGTLALDGSFYQFLSTLNRPPSPDGDQVADPDDPVRFVGVKLIYSSDYGRTWRNQDGSTPVRWEGWNDRSRQSMVFFEEDQDAFSLLTVLQMGRNYEHNRDGYVYVYSPNGNTEGSMNELVLFRAPKDRLLDRNSYEYFAGLGGSGAARWVRNIEGRDVVHTFPRGWVNRGGAHPYAWHPSVVYNAPLRLYIMANWGMGTRPDAQWFGKPSYLGFWTASHPWGPWTQVHEETAWLPEGDAAARAYQPQIAPKWMAPDGKSFWLVWTDFQGIEAYLRALIPPAASDQDDVTRRIEMMRRHMPYYSFNIQRVDLTIA